MIDKLLEFVRSLTYREVGIIVILALVAAPGYLLYWGTVNPDKANDLINGERYIGNVDDCILLSFRQQGRLRYRIVLNLRREPDATIALSAGNFGRWDDDRSEQLCQALKAIRSQ